MRRLPLLLALGAPMLGLALLSPADGEPSVALSRSPRMNFILHCQGCHLPDGSGMAGKVPALRGQLARFLQAPGGREYIVQVPGVSTSKLTDSDVAALMNWLVVEMGPEVPADFRPYSTAEVTALRARWLTRPAPVRAELLKAIDRLPPES